MIAPFDGSSENVMIFGAGNHLTHSFEGSFFRRVCLSKHSYKVLISDVLPM